MNVLISLRSEILKTKRTASWYITLLSAVVIPVIFVISVCADGVSPENGNNPLKAVYVECFKALNLLVLPMFIILLCTLLPQIEYRNNTWKQVFTAPQTKVQVFLSKFLTVQLLILLFLVVFFISTAISSILINLINPSVKLFAHPVDWGEIFLYGARTYLAVLAVSVVQFTIGLKIRNFVAPIALGFILWIIGNLLIFEMHSSLANVFPYSFSTMVMFSKFEKLMPAIQWSSVGLGIVFLLVGYVLFARKKVKG